MLENTTMSSMYTRAKERQSARRTIMVRWNVAGALQRPKTKKTKNFQIAFGRRSWVRLLGGVGSDGNTALDYLG